MKIEYKYVESEDAYNIVVIIDPFRYSYDASIVAILRVDMEQFKNIVRENNSYHKDNVTFFKNIKDCKIAIEQLEAVRVMSLIERGI